MNQKDCVSLFVDVFKWGMLILTLMIGWLLPREDTLDWLQPGEPGHRGVRVAFLAFNAVFWFGWAWSLERIRERAVSLAEDRRDFLRDVGFSPAHWVFALIALWISWYIVFDDLMTSRASLIAFTGQFLLPAVTLLGRLQRRRATKLVLPASG